MKKDTATEAQVVEEKGLALKGEAEILISQAIDKNVPVEALERLLAMRRELRAEQAKEEYDRAMAAFQAECPTIEKTKAVYEKDRKTIRYKYAPLEAVVDQVKALLAKYGFSYAINTIQDEKMLGVVCKVNHKFGHSEETTFSVPIGSEGYMSDVQKYGARLTFAKRYAFCNAFGILTGDEDNDAAPAHTEQPLTIRQMGEAAQVPTPPVQGNGNGGLATPKQLQFIRDLLKQKGYTEKSLAYKFDVINLEGLTFDQASDAIAGLKKVPANPAKNEPEINNDEIEAGIEKQRKEGGK